MTTSYIALALMLVAFIFFFPGRYKVTQPFELSALIHVTKIQLEQALICTYCKVLIGTEKSMIE